MNAPADRPDDVNAQCEALKKALRETLSPEGVATIAAFLQPATLTKPKTDQQKAAVCELEWFAELLIEMLGVEEYNRLLDELCL